MHFGSVIQSIRSRLGGPRPEGRIPRRIWTGLALASLVFCALAGQARADGEVAHRIVADIAEHFLRPRTEARLHTLLALDHVSSLAAIADWDEHVGDDSRRMARWRDVAIPLNARGYSPRRDCRNGACVVEKLEHFIAVLHDKSVSPEDRLDALKFVVCLTTDIHQPLHAVDNGDRGGARVFLVADGRRTSLRQLWDGAAKDDADDAREVALDLADSVSARDRRRWQRGTPADWANESHAVAKHFVYRYLPRSRVVTAGYESGVQEVSRDRLRRAGVRLAWILNRSL